jgi:pimeloyl-ACP methyl ester carboxylesterase
MAELIPQPPLLRLVEDCGHMSMMEQPEAVLSAMREWLGEGAGHGDE